MLLRSRPYNNAQSLLRYRLGRGASLLSLVHPTPQPTLQLSRIVLLQRLDLGHHGNGGAFRDYSTRPKHLKRREAAKEEGYVPKYITHLLELRAAIEESNITRLIAAYDQLRGTFKFGGKDVLPIAQLLHSTFRRNKGENLDKNLTKELISFAELLVSDVQSRSLPSDHAAFVRLLSFFKEARQFDTGTRFWSWLVEQDDSYVTPTVYGAAIELLAVKGRPAEETEALYKQALSRFPGNFLEYHLSPEAILQDRTQSITLRGVPVILLQGIMTARLLQGNARDAYLALDTALRLYPTTLPSRFFTLFVEERPVSEAYKVFLMGCRCGVTPGPDSLRLLLQKMRMAIKTAPLVGSSMLRSMLVAVYAYVNSGGPLNKNHLHDVVIGLTSLLQDANPQTDDYERVTDGILLVVKEVFDLWSSYGVRPGITTFNTLISTVAGLTGRKDVLERCLEDMQTLGIYPNAVTHRAILTAAGSIGELDLLASAWDNICSSQETTRSHLELADWQTLAKAARKMNETKFVRLELQRLSRVTHSGLASRIEGTLDIPGREEIRVEDDANERILGVLNQLLADVDSMTTRLRGEPSQDFASQRLPMALGSPPAEVSSREMRSIYDQMTTDKSRVSDRSTENILDTTAATQTELFAPVKEAASAPAMSTTGYTFGELRYQNWRIVNELLAEAEKVDSEYVRAVDEAIKNGTLPPKRTTGWIPLEHDGSSFGLSDLDSVESATAQADDSTSQTGNTLSIANTREGILRLRGRT